MQIVKVNTHIIQLVSYALQASAYPFMALIALQTSAGHSTPKMTVIERIEGPSHPEELVSQVEIAMDRHGAVVNKLKNERSQRDFERQLVKDQDDAYHQSLKADQEKARIAQEEKEALERAEEQKREELKKIELLEKKREQYINYLYTTLPEEPTEGKVANINFRLADGDRVVRKFKQEDTIDVSKSELIYFTTCVYLTVYVGSLSLCRNLPVNQTTTRSWEC